MHDIPSTHVYLPYHVLQLVAKFLKIFVGLKMKGQTNKPNECLPESVASDSGEPHNNRPLQAEDSLTCSDLDGSSHTAYRGESCLMGRLEKSYFVERPQKISRGTRGPYKKKGDAVERMHAGGNYYEQIQMRRQKILSFLEKDIFQINRPDIRRFMNSNHAYECLLPYHLFSPLLHEDAMFVNTSELAVIEDEIEASVELLNEVIAYESRPTVMEKSLICELLLYHQQRYINSTYGAEAGKSREYGRREKQQRRPKPQLNKRNTVFRLKIVLSRENDVDVRNGKLYFKTREHCN